MALRKIDNVSRWREEGLDAYGKSLYGAREIVEARWDDWQGEVMNDKGEMIVSMGRVYTDIDDEFKINDRLALGEEATIADSFIVKGVKKSRNGSGTRLLLTAYLGKA